VNPYEKFDLSKSDLIESAASRFRSGTPYPPIGTCKQGEVEGARVKIAHFVEQRTGLFSVTTRASSCRVTIFVCWSCEPDIPKPFTGCSCSTKMGSVTSWRFGRLGQLETRPSAWK
jgi:hypothetical protein